MKQIITNYSKYYVNDRGQFNGLYIRYWYDGNLWWRTNYVNGKQYGLNSGYHYIESGKIKYQRYFL